MKRTFFILITLGVNAAFAQSDINATFSQDVATVFTEKHGLPANKALDIKLQNEVPIAFTEKSAAQWDGQSWKATQAQAAGEKAPKVKLPQAHWMFWRLSGMNHNLQSAAGMACICIASTQRNGSKSFRLTKNTVGRRAKSPRWRLIQRHDCGLAQNRG